MKGNGEGEMVVEACIEVTIVSYQQQPMTLLYILIYRFFGISETNT
jgi:hypothetical protein